MTATVALFIPFIGNLFLGLDWDMGLAEDASHDNEITEHPIEDPRRSFVMDYNREKPVTLDLSISVSTNPTLADLGILGPARLTLLYENLLSLKAQQSVDPSAFLDVFTGVRVHRNMAIQAVKMSRSEEQPNEAKFDISLREIRMARSPSETNRSYLMDANNGPVSNDADLLVSSSDRPIVEATNVRRGTRLGRPSLSQDAIINAAYASGGAALIGLF